MMPTPHTIKFLDDKHEEKTIDPKDLIAVLSDKTPSIIIYVEHDSADAAAPPRVRVSKTASPLPPSARSDVAEERETHVIVSTGSGTGQAVTFFDEAVRPLLRTLFPSSYHGFSVYHTESASSILNLTNDIFLPRANKGTPIRIVLFSGDGGVIDVLNGLLSKPHVADYTPPQVVLIPLGTANALYHSINGGKENTWGLNALASSSYHPLPVFTATFSPGARLLVDEARNEEELPKDPKTGTPTLHGAVVCSWGMHSSLVGDSDTAEYRKFGVERFKMAAKEALFPADGSLPHPYKAKVSILQGETWKPLEQEEHMYVLASMVSNLEKTFTISPASKPLDGSLHLVQFGPADGNEVMRIMGLAYQGGKHVEDDAVLYEAIDGLRIQFEGKEEDGRWRRICVDGKIVRLEKDGWVEMRKESMHVLDVACS